VAMLAEALTAAHLQGYVRVFADEGPPMATLLGRLVAQRTGPVAAGGMPLDHLARLLRAFDAGHARRGGAAIAAGMVEPLTDREVEVLGLLAAGRSAASTTPSWPWRWWPLRLRRLETAAGRPLRRRRPPDVRPLSVAMATDLPCIQAGSSSNLRFGRGACG